jgi:hypothetical protein
MRVPILFLLLTTSCWYVLACSVAKSVDAEKPFPLGDYQYTSYDEKGDKVVEGRISITSTEQRRIGSEESTQLKGNWELKKVGSQEKIGGQVGSGDLIGTINKNEVDINLNPNISDANVYLRGKIDGKRFHGTWTFSGYAGPVSKGTFEATRK